MARTCQQNGCIGSSFGTHEANLGLTQHRAVQVEELAQIGCEAQAIQCDVTDQEQQKEVFTKHMEQFGRLDIAVLNAGVGEAGEFQLLMQTVF